MPAAYARLVLRQFGADPERAARIVLGTGIDPADRDLAAPANEITLKQLFRLVENVSAVEPAGWGLSIGRNLGVAAHGPLGLAMASATTLAEALAVLEQYAHVRGPYFRLVSEETTEAYRLRVEPQMRMDRAIWRPLIETLVLSLQGVIEAALGRVMTDARIRFDYPVPDYVEVYGNCLNAGLEFDAAATEIEIPGEWLAFACPFADEATHRSAREKLEAASRRLHSERLIAAEVDRILDGEGVPPGLPEVASRLGLSQRTLVRRLAESGTSFRSLVDHHRARRVLELLADPTLSVAEVADRLGYREVSNLSRACRRWYGRSPRALRAGLLERED